MAKRRTRRTNGTIIEPGPKLLENEVVLPEPEMMEILASELGSLDRMLSDYGYALDKCKPYGGFGEVRAAIFVAERVVLVGCALGEEIRKLREAVEANGKRGA